MDLKQLLCKWKCSLIIFFTYPVFLDIRDQLYYGTLLSKGGKDHDHKPHSGSLAFQLTNFWLGAQNCYYWAIHAPYVGYIGYKGSQN